MDALILAAGQGTRLRPITLTRPKPMIYIAGKPLLEWNLKALASLNGKQSNGKRGDRIIERIFIVVGYRGDVIENYFGDNYMGIPITYIRQEELSGTASAVYTARDLMSGNFIALNGDLLISEEFLKNFINNYKNNNPVNTLASMALISVDDPSHFGVAEVEGNVVTGIEEKPESPKSNLANAGIYIFTSEIFNEIENIEKSKRNEYELPDALNPMIKKGGVMGFECAGLWMDIGRPWDVLSANEIMLKKLAKNYDYDTCIKGTVEKFTNLKGEVYVGEGSVIKSGSYIEGPCCIGKDCQVGPNCYIRAYTMIGDRVHIGNAVEVKNSLVMSDTNIGHLSYIGDSIICEKCNFGAGTSIANLRFDNKNIKVWVKDRFEDCGRRKFGAVIGDNVNTGINVSIYPGRTIYPGARIDPGSVVKKTIYTGDYY